MTEFKQGDEVVRTKGDYVVGRIGNIVAIDIEKSRAQVAWKGENKTWVSFNAIAPTSIPYQIIPRQYDKNGRGISWQKYQPLSQPINK